MIERVSLSDIVANGKAMRKAIVGSRQCLELLLTACVPKLEFNLLSGDFNRFVLDANSNGYSKIKRTVGCLREFFKQVRLANVRVANVNNLHRLAWLRRLRHLSARSGAAGEVRSSRMVFHWLKPSRDRAAAAALLQDVLDSDLGE